MTAPDPQAGALYESAISHPGIAEFPFEHARIHLAHGMWLRRGKRHTEARAALSRAAEEFDQLGAQPWADRARAELRAAGAPAKQTRGEAAILSPQQRRVAELAASGETSKAIAAQLSLSPRTVDTHLYNALRKLGISRRAALANALRDHDTTTGAPPKGTASASKRRP
jgi:DNA-binding NarL/FixJ family response regulator